MDKKVSELTGAELDLWVAKAEGLNSPEIVDGEACNYIHHYENGDDGWWTLYEPSKEWDLAGPIIQREAIKLQPVLPSGSTWHAIKTTGFVAPNADGSVDMSGMEVFRGKGSTPIEAAMRCYVRYKFGETVPVTTKEGA